MVFALVAGLLAAVDINRLSQRLKQIPQIQCLTGLFQNITPGVCVGAQSRRDVGDKFLLRINQLLELRDTPLLCQVLRIDTRRAGVAPAGFAEHNPFPGSSAMGSLLLNEYLFSLL